MNIHRNICDALVASTVALVASEARAVTVCEDFNGHTPGAVASPFITLPLGFLPPFYAFRFQALAAIPLGITTYFVDHELQWAHAADMSMSDAFGDSPFDVEFKLYAYAGPVVVEAFEPGGNLIFSNTYPNGVHSVAITSGNRIEKVVLTDGDNETWIDDVCATW